MVKNLYTINCTQKMQNMALSNIVERGDLYNITDFSQLLKSVYINQFTILNTMLKIIYQ